MEISKLCIDFVSNIAQVGDLEVMAQVIESIDDAKDAVVLSISISISISSMSVREFSFREYYLYVVSSRVREVKVPDSKD